MKKLFLTEAKDNQVFPVGAGLWTRLHPEDRVKVPYTHWDFDSTTTRLPEFAGPGLGRESNRVVVELEADEGASGVLYALGGIGGGLTLYMDKGQLVYEYNMMMIERYIGRSAAPIGAGKHRIVVDTSIGKPGGPADVAISVDDRRRCGSTSSGRSPARSPRAKRSTSASTSVRRCRSTISTARRSRSAAKSARSPWTSRDTYGKCAHSGYGTQKQDAAKALVSKEQARKQTRKGNQ